VDKINKSKQMTVNNWLLLWI